MESLTCVECKNSFPHAGGRGRKPKKCPTCRGLTNSSADSKPDVNVDANDEAPIPTPPSSQTSMGTKPKKDVEPLGTYPFEVFITNGIGFRYRGDDAEVAKKVFKQYKGMSERGFGQVGFETVSLYHKGEIVSQYDPRVERDIENKLNTGKMEDFKGKVKEMVEGSLP